MPWATFGQSMSFAFMTEVEVAERLETGRYLYEVVPSTGQVAGAGEVERVKLLTE